jgi:general L-amino acid transport system substrate-binding protein
VIFKRNSKQRKGGEKMKRFKLMTVFVVIAFLTTVGFAMAGTMDDVKAKGFISVGVNEGLAGFSKPDEKGEWRGLDVDTARAISVAVFGAKR